MNSKNKLMLFWSSILVMGFLGSFFLLNACSPVKFNVDNKKVSSSDVNCSGNTCNFVWRADETWGDCSQACGGGTQTRTVTCVDVNLAVVADTNCAEAKPSAQQNCNTQACSGDGPNWNPGAWSSCSLTCGSGTRTRTVVCQNSQTVVDDSQCTAAKPNTSESCNTQSCSGNMVNHTTTRTVDSNANQVDILVIFDDSSSMLQDNNKLASRLSGFVTSLQNSNIDWQMCITSTDTNYYNGRPIQWSGTSTRVVNKNTPNLNSVFQQTIADNGAGGSNDERGIRAAIKSIENNSNANYRCYRPEAALAVVLLSDEDERSVGGVKSYDPVQYQPLEDLDHPASFVSQVRSTFNTSTFTKKVAFNSIVVRDSYCQALQFAQGTPSFLGTKYRELSSLTGGHVGNICDTDYSANLNYFATGIANTLSELTLDCTPSGSTPTVTIPSGYNYNITGNKITFTPVLPAGTTVTINYQCMQI